MNVELQLPPKLIDVFLGEADYRGAYGGRGSAKTRSFAKMTAVRGLMWSQAGEKGIILCGREYMNSLDESSLAEVKAAIESEPWLAAHYEVGEKYVRTKDRNIEYAFTGLHTNLDSIKSKARIRLLWVDEGDPVTETAWQKAIPSVREHDSEIWVTWNPENEHSATHNRFRLNPPARSKIIELSWRDNPWFPAILERQRLEDFEKRPDSYDHIWEGGFKTVTEGAYYAKALAQAKADNRIGLVPREPMMTCRAVWDIGGTGAKADATAIWIVQHVGLELRFIDYYEAVGQPLATHINWLREKGYGNALCVLPHDGAKQDFVHDASYEGTLKKADFEVEVIANQGKGAAAARIEAARNLFHRMRFDEAKCAGGLKAIAAYHEKIDEQRRIGLGPDHDWASHGADAFGLAAVAYTEPGKRRKPESKPQHRHYGATSTSWMGA